MQKKSRTEGWNPSHHKYMGSFIESNPTASFKKNHPILLGGDNPKQLSGPIIVHGFPADFDFWDVTLDGWTHTPQREMTPTIPR